MALVLRRLEDFEARSRRRIDEMERRFAEALGDAGITENTSFRGLWSHGPPREPRRDTIFTDGGTAVSHGKPKMEKPEIFNGEYTVLYSVLNWLLAVHKYLLPHNIPKDAYPQYAYTYMGKGVKAWYDGRFEAIDTDPHWELFEQAIKERYLPEDHVIQVTKRYEGIVQTGPLSDYVEKWQSLMVAVRAAGIRRSDEDHVIQFVTGLTRIEDRKSILDKDPANLEAVYRAVTKIRHYSLLAHKYGRTGDSGLFDRTRDHKNQLKMLQGAEKDKAFRDGRCIGCGRKGHFLNDCYQIKKTLKVLKLFEKTANQACTPKHPKSGTCKGVRFHHTEVDGGSESEYESDIESGGPEVDSGTENEGEVEIEEDEGNESPGPQEGGR